MTPYLEACLSGGGRIGQVGIGRNNLLKPVRRASCKKILCNTEIPEPAGSGTPALRDHLRLTVAVAHVLTGASDNDRDLNHIIYLVDGVF